MSSQFAALPGNRFTRVTPDDHSAWIWLPTLLALTHSFCILGFRCLVKRGRYSLDDVALAVGYIFALGHWIPTFIALHDGLGKASRLVTETQQHNASKAIFGGRIPLIIALCLAKCSVVLLIRHVFTRDLKKAWQTCNVAVCILITWGLMAVITITAGCSSESVVAENPSLHCPNHALRWKLISILDALTEFGIVILISCLLIPLQMRFSSKLAVTSAFAFRLPCIVFSALFVKTYLSRASNSDPSLSLAIPSAWQESLLGYSLISATIPCLKTFMKNFQTGGVGFTEPAHTNNSKDVTASCEASIESHHLVMMTPSVCSKTHLRPENAETASKISNSIAEDGSLEFVQHPR